MNPTFVFHQVDVFTDTPLRGNPLAVVVGGDDLTDEQMARFAKWTNLSETTFLLRPTHPEADYRVRIFTPGGELPFAGHPTLGSCHVWLAEGGQKKGECVIQECGVGLIRVRCSGSRLAFAAPPLLRSGEADADLVATLARALRLPASDLLAVQWVDNGPGWVAVLLASREQVLALRPDFAAMGLNKVGVVGPWLPADGSAAQWEVRAFAPGLGVNEDPVTGSLNAALAQWLIQSGRAPAQYVASQGTALGRQGRVHIEQQSDVLWVGGEVAPCIRGQLTLDAHP
jgi:PhzF family phenazine biosynthesis protein